jgi:hypothetical protein
MLTLPQGLVAKRVRALTSRIPFPADISDAYET